jgi:hypothetical protein
VDLVSRRTYISICLVEMNTLAWLIKTFHWSLNWLVIFFCYWNSFLSVFLVRSIAAIFSSPQAQGGTWPIIRDNKRRGVQNWYVVVFPTFTVICLLIFLLNRIELNQGKFKVHIFPMLLEPKLNNSLWPHYAGRTGEKHFQILNFLQPVIISMNILKKRESEYFRP